MNIVRRSAKAAVTSAGADNRVYSKIVAIGQSEFLCDLDLHRLDFGLRIAHLLPDVADRGGGPLPYAGAAQFELHEPSFVAQVRLMTRQLFEKLRHLAAGNRSTRKQNSQQDGNHECDRRSARQSPVHEPAHERGENEAQYPCKGERYEQIAPYIECHNEQRCHHHTGGAVDRG
jgi:hypothetical protein